MDVEKKMIIDKLLTSEPLRVIASANTKWLPKTPEASEKARKAGNVIYMQSKHTAQMHEEILRLYCKSIVLAPDNSEELALAFGNRSAFLLHLQKYRESIQDIERALKITQSTSLKEKLSKRKAECCDSLLMCEQKEIECKVSCWL